MRLCAFARKHVAPFLCLLSLTSCFEPKEGCLDISAVNFDASADKDCDKTGCACIYPKLQVTVDQRYDTLPYRRDSAYLGTNGKLFRLHDVAFYLSDFQVFKNTDTYVVSDTLGLRVFSSSGTDTLRPVFRNDFQLVRLETQTYAVGTLRESGTFSGVKIRLGLDTDANRVIPNLAPTSHPLYVQPDDFWQGRDTGFVFLKIVVSRNTTTTARDTLTFSQADVGNFFINEGGVFVHLDGVDFRLRLRADYQQLLRNIDWTAGDKSTWKQQVIANLSTVFSVSQ